MRGSDAHTGALFSYIDLEVRIPKKHPLRPVKKIVDDILSDLSEDFSRMYSHTGRPSIPPEQLLRGLLLQLFYSIRSERQLMEQLDFNVLYRWFTGLGIDERVWDASSYCKNRDRLLEHEIAARFLRGIVEHPQVQRLLSKDHFSVDGTLIGAWASMKSFRPRDGSGDGPRHPAGRNCDVDFHGTRRKNDTHASTTDEDARLYRKSRGQGAQLCHMGHALMENRHGLAVAACVTQATGHGERDACLEMIDGLNIKEGASIGADRAYDACNFKDDLRARGLVPHIAHRSNKTWGGFGFSDPPGYDLSQRHRKRVEEIFAWVKGIAGLSKTKFRGRKRVAASFTLAVAAYNLIRLPKLLEASP